MEQDKKTKVIRMECNRPDWIRVVNAARRTWGKKPINKEPSERFKNKILLAEHSPIRLLEYDFTIEGVRQWVTVHLARHHQGCEKFIHSQRQDINDSISAITDKVISLLSTAGLTKAGWKERDYMFQGYENDMDMTCNAQAFINISRKRLCACASPETRAAWGLVIEMLREVDPVLADKCVPECVYRSFCPEIDRSCGYCKTDDFQRKLVKYRSVEPEEWREIKDYDGFVVSNLGRVMKCGHTDAKGKYREPFIVAITNNKNRGGYDYVHLNKELKSLSRLVAKAFVYNDDPENKVEVNHKDGNKFNNTYSNLEWVTSKENKEHAWRTGLCNAKHSMKKIRCIETDEVFNSITECSEKMNIDRSYIHKHLKGLLKSVKGHTFERVDDKSLEIQFK